MTGSTNLSHLLASMSPDLRDETFVFITIDAGAPIPDVGAVMQFNEAEGVTLIAPKGAAEATSLAHEFPCQPDRERAHPDAYSKFAKRLG